MHASEVRCISKGKAHKRDEFGNKISLATTADNRIVVGIHSFAENHYDGKTLSNSLCQVKDLLAQWPQDAYVDRGYTGYDGYVFGTQVHRQGLKRHSQETKSYLRKRASIEPVISRLKSDHRMGCNRLAGPFGDMMSSLLAGCTFNLKKLGKWLKEAIFIEFLAVISSLMLQIRSSLPLIGHVHFSKYPRAPKEGFILNWFFWVLQGELVNECPVLNHCPAPEYLLKVAVGIELKGLPNE